MSEKEFLKMVGAKIRKARLTQRISMEKLAGKSGITFSCLSQIENGHTNFRICTVRAVAETLNVDLKELL